MSSTRYSKKLLFRLLFNTQRERERERERAKINQRGLAMGDFRTHAVVLSTKVGSMSAPPHSGA